MTMSTSTTVRGFSATGSAVCTGSDIYLLSGCVWYTAAARYLFGGEPVVRDRAEPGQVPPDLVQTSARQVAVSVFRCPGRAQCLLLLRETVAKLIGAELDEVVFVPNATHALNTVLRNFEWREGDVIVGCPSLHRIRSMHTS